MMRSKFSVLPGKPHPLGPTVDKNGVNFSVFSENATSIELLLFDKHDDTSPKQIISLDPIRNKTFNFWHVYVKGLKAGAHYAYRVDGPLDLANGHRFNKNKVLIDPYAKGNTDALWDRPAACSDKDNLATAMRSIVIDVKGYDWAGDRRLNLPIKDLIIYEMHVGGFTRSPSAKAKNPGSFASLKEKIPYLKELGINAVELLPIFEFDDKEILRRRSDGTALMNYWGYSTIGFFSPDAGYCVSPEQGQHLNEFRDLVKALHQAGIEVILDVVFNHTNEGNQLGPTISFKGFDNSIYYCLSPQAKQYYLDYSGCGNTLNCNHPIVEKFIIECLTFWVKEMHIDGFRFDEGSILSRGEDGAPLQYPPILWNLEILETFAETKLIAEAWDAGGLYEIGCFPGYRWSEWNGRFRDDVRRFVRGEPGLVGAVASRIAGSSDIYQCSRHKPVNSVNFITCHDGFTLMDLVSYNCKHNEANGEDNRDGNNDNFSWNCGVEGAIESVDINHLRWRHIKNFVAILLLAQGVPMILSGDEVGRTQQGNNNAYCQDNELSWLDWNLLNKNNELLRFFKGMIAFRKNNSCLRRGEFFRGEINSRGVKDISWYGCQLSLPPWNDPNAKVLAFTLGSFVASEPDLHVILNMADQELTFELPKIISRQWYRYADTALIYPEDIMERGREKLVKGDSYLAQGRSVIILVAK